MANLSFDFVDNDKTVTAKVGDIILITLPENATTGFQWNVRHLRRTLSRLRIREQTRLH
jgi:predicted secreted protein